MTTGQFSTIPGLPTQMESLCHGYNTLHPSSIETTQSSSSSDQLRKLAIQQSLRSTRLNFQKADQLYDTWKPSTPDAPGNMKTDVTWDNSSVVSSPMPFCALNQGNVLFPGYDTDFANVWPTTTPGLLGHMDVKADPESPGILSSYGFPSSANAFSSEPYPGLNYGPLYDPNLFSSFPNYSLLSTVPSGQQTSFPLQQEQPLGLSHFHQAPQYATSGPISQPSDAPPSMVHPKPQRQLLPLLSTHLTSFGTTEQPDNNANEVGRDEDDDDEDICSNEDNSYDRYSSVSCSTGEESEEEQSISFLCSSSESTSSYSSSTTSTSTSLCFEQDKAASSAGILSQLSSAAAPATTPTTPPAPASSKAMDAEKEIENRQLLTWRAEGLSYREIKERGGYKEAESTLRGRYRTLTKAPEDRVRRPDWTPKDDELLAKAVQRNRRDSKRPWKRVADYIYRHGGSYRFGNATCRKRWMELSPADPEKKTKKKKQRREERQQQKTEEDEETQRRREKHQHKYDERRLLSTAADIKAENDAMRPGGSGGGGHRYRTCLPRI